MFYERIVASSDPLCAVPCLGEGIEAVQSQSRLPAFCVDDKR